MRVMVIVKASEISEAATSQGTEVSEALDKFNKELVNAGVLLAAETLRPSVMGKRVRFCASKQIVTDGPFAPTSELVSGYWLWQVKSIDEAIEWLRRCPTLSAGESEIELRPVAELSGYVASSDREWRAD